MTETYSFAMTPWSGVLLVVTNDFHHDRLNFTLIDRENDQVIAYKSVSYAKEDADDAQERTLWDLLEMEIKK